MAKAERERKVFLLATPREDGSNHYDVVDEDAEKRVKGNKGTGLFVNENITTVLETTYMSKPGIDTNIQDLNAVLNDLKKLQAASEESLREKYGNLIEEVVAKLNTAEIVLKNKEQLTAPSHKELESKHVQEGQVDSNISKTHKGRVKAGARALEEYKYFIRNSREPGMIGSFHRVGSTHPFTYTLQITDSAFNRFASERGSEHTGLTIGDWDNSYMLNIFIEFISNDFSDIYKRGDIHKLTSEEIYRFCSSKELENIDDSNESHEKVNKDERAFNFKDRVTEVDQDGTPVDPNDYEAQKAILHFSVKEKLKHYDGIFKKLSDKPKLSQSDLDELNKIQKDLQWIFNEYGFKEINLEDPRERDIFKEIEELNLPNPQDYLKQAYETFLKVSNKINQYSQGVDNPLTPKGQSIVTNFLDQKSRKKEQAIIESIEKEIIALHDNIEQNGLRKMQEINKSIDSIRTYAEFLPPEAIKEVLDFVDQKRKSMKEPALSEFDKVIQKINELDEHYQFNKYLDTVISVLKDSIYGTDKQAKDIAADIIKEIKSGPYDQLSDDSKKTIDDFLETRKDSIIEIVKSQTSKHMHPDNKKSIISGIYRFWDKLCQALKETILSPYKSSRKHAQEKLDAVHGNLKKEIKSNKKPG